MSYIATCRARLAALQAKKEVNILVQKKEQCNVFES